MARVCGVPINTLLSKGEQNKVVAQLLRFVRFVTQNFLYFL